MHVMMRSAHDLETDSIAPGPDSDEDEVWWFDYFMDGDGNTYPEDVHSDGPLPQWRDPHGGP